MLETLTINLSPDELVQQISRSLSQFRIADHQLPKIVIDAVDSNGRLIALEVELTHFSAIDLMAIGLTNANTITIQITDVGDVIAVLQQEGINYD